MIQALIEATPLEVNATADTLCVGEAKPTIARTNDLASGLNHELAD